MMKPVVTVHRLGRQLARLLPHSFNSGCHRTIQTSAPMCRLNDFQMMKITKEFDHLYDRNKDGYIEKKDVDDFKRRMRVFAEMVQQQAVKQPYGSGFDDYWSLMNVFADTDRDGRLSRDEWIEVWTKVVETADDVSFSALPQWVQQLPTSLFPVIDHKSDQIIDPVEYRLFWFHVGGYPSLDDDTLAHYFKVMTEDGKYPLDIRRMEDLYADYYLSPDPSSPGKYIAGPINFKPRPTS